MFFSSKPLSCPSPVLLPIWVASNVTQNEVGKPHYQLLLSEQLRLNTFLRELSGASCLAHSLTWLHAPGLYKFRTTVESANVQGLTPSEVPPQ